MRFVILVLSLTMGTALVAGASDVALVKPEAPGAFCGAAPESAHCMGRVPDCMFCHTSTAPVAWNPFGLEVRGALPGEASFTEELGAALRAIESADSDGHVLASYNGFGYNPDPFLIAELTLFGNFQNVASRSPREPSGPGERVDATARKAFLFRKRSAREHQFLTRLFFVFWRVAHASPLG